MIYASVLHNVQALKTTLLSVMGGGRWFCLSFRRVYRFFPNT